MDQQNQLKMPPNMPQAKPANPLSNWFRQPKIYVRLPSKGEFYPDGALDVSASEEYAVFAMTAKDELMFKTPDALLSGQSTVEIVKSCIPSIVDPWQMPSIDLDAALVAIRIATYGDNMEVTANCPHCSAENHYDINLLQWLEKIGQFTYKKEIQVEPLTIHVRPYSYREVTKTSLKTFEQQRIFQIINDETLSDEVKLDKFGESFVKLTELTVDVIANCVFRIDTPDGTTTDYDQIHEFISNAPKAVFDTIQNHITSMKEEIELAPQLVHCEECEQEFTMPITMDQASFFAKGS
jgi:hypothetical protein